MLPGSRAGTDVSTAPLLTFCTGSNVGASTDARADATQHQLKHGTGAGNDAGTGIHTTNGTGTNNGTGSSTDASQSWLAQRCSTAAGTNIIIRCLVDPTDWHPLRHCADFINALLQQMNCLIYVIIDDLQIKEMSIGLL